MAIIRAEATVLVVDDDPGPREALGLVLEHDFRMLFAQNGREALGLLARSAVDEMIVFIAPVLLGDGTRLFSHPGGTNLTLERLSLSQADKATNLWFRVLDSVSR